MKISQIPLLTILLCSASPLFAQQATRTDVLTALQSEDHAKAVSLAKALVKADDRNAESWYLLGSAYFRSGKYKDAVKYFQKATDLDAHDLRFQTALGYDYMATNDDRAGKVANGVIAANARSADAWYIKGVMAYRDDFYSTAYEAAKKVLEIDPNFSRALRLKAQALIASYIATTGKVLAPGTPGDLLVEAAADAEKYLASVTDDSERKALAQELADLKWFADYYERPENRNTRDVTTPEISDPSKTPIKFTSKPRPGYTDAARNAGISGVVRLLVAFDANGKIGPVMVLKSLDPGLDRQAVLAAKAIKFVPPAKSGVPYSTVKTVEYTFEVY